MLIRKIQLQDNLHIEKIIKSVFPEFEMPLIGTAYEDIETSAMFEAYQEKNAVYFIIEENNIVVGGGGIKALNASDGSICELQKMYFSPSIRGKGYGQQLFKKCLDTAKKLGYKQCYLESALQLKAAIHIYEKNGFKHLEKSLGNTGHYSCGVFMLKNL